MNITSNYNLYRYNSQEPHTCSFGSAADITLKYLVEKHPEKLPTRIKSISEELIRTGNDDITLRDLHLQTYSGLLEEGMTLDKARNMFIEFREVLPYKVALPNKTKHSRMIEEKMNPEDLPLYIIQERWGKLSTLEEIAASLFGDGKKNRHVLAWITDKLRIPVFPKNYQRMLEASDEKRNNIIANKTRAYHRAHPEKIRQHNMELSQNPRNKQLNKQLADDMWSLLPHVRQEKKNFRAEHPEYDYTTYNIKFWQAHPEFRAEMSKVRSELGEKRREARKINKK